MNSNLNQEDPHNFALEAKSFVINKPYNQFCVLSILIHHTKEHPLVG
jgi:hypothetical protein